MALGGGGAEAAVKRWRGAARELSLAAIERAGCAHIRADHAANTTL